MCATHPPPRGGRTRRDRKGRDAKAWVRSAAVLPPAGNGGRGCTGGPRERLVWATEPGGGGGGRPPPPPKSSVKGKNSEEPRAPSASCAHAASFLARRPLAGREGSRRRRPFVPRATQRSIGRGRLGRRPPPKVGRLEQTCPRRCPFYCVRISRRRRPPPVRARRDGPLVGGGRKKGSKIAARDDENVKTRQLLRRTYTSEE
jgi:hypothetical protein